jgi:hypothetical protein
MRQGPQYLFCGSRLTDDTFMLRLLLEGLNTWSRQWQETITIQDDGTLTDLEFEVNQFKYLAHLPVEGWADPNVVVAFMDRMSHNRATEATLKTAQEWHRAWFVVGNASDVR